jgi:protocatechuate 3,4-dioxygenase beta subunit
MKKRAALSLVLALLVALVAWVVGFGPSAPAPESAFTGGDADSASVSSVQGDLAGGAVTAASQPGVARVDLTEADRRTGVHGVVLHAVTGQPLGGVEVMALGQLPSFEPLVNRFRGLFQGGMFTETRRPPQVLGSTFSRPDGTFELSGLREGILFLDGRSDGFFVRTPATVRLARGEVVEQVELRAEPGGRVRGIILGADGGPVAGATVSLRPGLNAFLGQITERRYRWLETVSGDDGRFDIPGVPPGNGYVLSANAETFALEEKHGIDVREAEVVELVVQGHAGAAVAGLVLDPDGRPVESANVAMIYLDISRVLFSADGRSEPIVTDSEGRFRVHPVAAGRVAFVAATDGKAPSNIEDLAVVDGGVYEDMVLQLGAGETVRGLVVDDEDKPVIGAKVELRPWERPDDPQFLKMVLKIRRVEVETDGEGRFVASGLTGERLVVQAGKPGYTTALRFGVGLDEEVKIQISRGAVVRGKAQLADGTPVTRFRVDTRTREPRRPQESAAGDDEAAAADANSGRGQRNQPDGWSGASERWGGRGRRSGRSGTVQLAEGQRMEDRGMNGSWREIASQDGTFELTGIPPGSIRVRLRSDGRLDPDSQTVELKAGEQSDELVFVFEEGITVAGRVVDELTGKPVSDAQVTAYRQREQRRSGFFQVDIDPEDMDFLALSSTQGRRSAITDSQGRFEVTALGEGEFRFTARHPDKAKSSAKDIALTKDKEIPFVEIEIGAGGAIEGNATGYGMQPLRDAVIAAFSMQSGTLRSASTDERGYFRIDGLPGGQYAVFKSRMDERADNIPLELLSNMRLKTTTVREGRTSRLDIHDEGEDGVRVFGTVRENGVPVPRALITMLGTDQDGFLGMGVRANAAGMDGRYELVGIRPGDYVVQVSRFQGRPVQTSFPIEVPEETRDFLFDIELPTSEVSGRVLDTRGQPVSGVRVSLGSSDGGLSGADGLVGMIAQGGLSQARTDENGEFRMRSVSAGSYHLVASGNMMGRRNRRSAEGESQQKYGEARVEGVEVDGYSNLEGLLVTVPLAGTIRGVVTDGSGIPVADAEIAYVRTDVRKESGQSGMLASLFGTQTRPIRSDEQGRFEIDGLTPGTYDLSIDSEALEAARETDLRVNEDGVTDVTLRIVRGATLRLRATNVDSKSIPIAQISLLDGRGKAVVSRVSTLSIMRRMFSAEKKVNDSGWYEFGSVPPDTYTVVVREQGKPELRITRTIIDGEVVEWDVNVEAELARQRDR